MTLTAPPATPTVSTVALERVWHVGSLDAAERGEWSYEGDGLSVSVHSDEWQEIARLPGPVWKVRRRDRKPLRFLDAYGVSLDQRAHIEQWALDAGWLRRETWWAVGTFDENGEPDGHSLFPSEDEARAEAEPVDPDLDDERPVWAVPDHLVSTDTFPAERVLHAHPWEVLLTVWVARLHPDLDGVWWADTYNPWALSCPRGVLVHGLRDVTVNSTAGGR